jgi:hypothetical protein
MRCRLIVLAFAMSILPAAAHAAPTTTIDIGKIMLSGSPLS